MDSPLGTIQAPPSLIVNSCPPAAAETSSPRDLASFGGAGGLISTNTLPLWTKKLICIFLEFLTRFEPAGGSSTMPLPKNGRVWIFAYVKALPATSRVIMLEDAKAMSAKCV